MRKIFLAFSVAVLLFAGELAWSQPASADPVVPGLTTIGEVNIGFQKGLFPAGLQVGGLLAGLPIVRVVPDASFITVKSPMVDLVKQAISAIPGVSFVEDNALMHTLAAPNDPQFGSQYGPSMMGFPAAWGSVGYGSSSITVALVDSGILKTHQDFAPARILQGHDYVNNDADPDDTCGHGTHTAGTVGATTNNGLGVAGMSQVKILEMKALQKGGLFGGSCSGSTAGIAQAITDAANQGAKVISMSIGGGASSAMENAVNYAWGTKGVILVAAAGNDGGTNSVDYPAAYANVIAVAALDSNKTRASYSDGGPQLDISAPGSNVVSTYTGANNATYATLSGTSMATPHVAGAIALALGCEDPGTTPQQVVNALYSTAEDLGASGRDNLYGYGLARADNLVAAICTGAPPPVNHPPTAGLTTSGTGMTVNVDGSSSSDPDGDALTYAWTFGDGGTATGVTASHTYTTAGTKSIGLTVTDIHGATATASGSFVATAPVDPDPSTPTLTSGQTVTLTLNATVNDTYFKIQVPAGKTQFKAAMTGPSCGFLGFGTCPVDGNLYTRFTARPTDTLYDCRPAAKGNAETCTHASPAAGYWYMRVKWVSGSGQVTLTPTIT